MATINGKLVKSARVFEQGGYWRWRIVDERGREYLDGGNYRERENAERGMDGAFDRTTNPDALKLRKLITDGGYSQRGAARELDISERMMRYYCAGEQPVPKVVMLALEHLVTCQTR